MTNRYPITTYTLFSLAIIVLLWRANVVQLFRSNIWAIQFVHAVLSGLDIDIPNSFPDNHVRAPLWLAKQALIEGHSAKARKLVEPVLDQNTSQAYFLLGSSYELEGRYSEAIQAWFQANDKPSREALFGLAADKITAGELDIAYFIYKSLYDLDQESTTLVLADFVWRNYRDSQQAKTLLETSQIKFNQSIYMPLWKSRLADLYRAEADWDNAEKTYLQLIEDFPDHIEAYLGIGQVYIDRDQYIDSAIANYKKAVSINPEAAEPYFLIATGVQQKLGFDESQVWFQKAIELNPNVIDWHRSYANAARSDGKIAFSIEHYNETIVNFSANDEVYKIYFELSWAYYLNNQLELALNAIETAIEIAPRPNAVLYERAGLLYESSNMLEQAKRAFEMAEKLR